MKFFKIMSLLLKKFNYLFRKEGEFVLSAA